MTETRVVRIHKTLYARIPPDVARRLGLRAGQAVDIQVKPRSATVGEALRELRGKYKGRLTKVPDRELWDA